MTTPTSKLEWALHIASLGFRVFPIAADAKSPPSIAAWPVYATDDPEKIRRFWTNLVMDGEEDFNIGVTGGTFIDVDNKNGLNGSEMLDVLQDLHGDLPPTLTVETPTGGFHRYFLADILIGNSASVMAPGLDVRGRAGYVVGPGSTIGDKAYRIVGDIRTVAELPPAWAVLARKAKAVKAASKLGHGGTVADGVELDTEDVLAYAVSYLTRQEYACAGARNDAAFRLAARVKDFGVSSEKLLELMAGVWNPGNNPPLEESELADVIAHVYIYGREQVGGSSPVHDFPPIIESPDVPKEKSAFAPRPFLIPKPDALKARQWVLGKRLLKRKVSLLIAPPGTSKSTLSLNMALAIATGRNDIMGMYVPKREKVWMYNNEDDLDEMDLRLAAAALHHKVLPDDLLINGEQALFANSGDEKPLKIAEWSEDGKELSELNVRPLIQHIIENKIGVLMVDPFAETHPGAENSNEDIGAVGRMYRKIAKKANCAVLLIHHTNKPPAGSSVGRPGDMNTSRGGSALIGVARVMMTLFNMSKEDAALLGVPKAERHLYVRLDGAKANMSLITDAAVWFKKISVPVPTDETAVTHRLESVGALETVEFNATTEDEERLNCGGVLLRN